MYFSGKIALMQDCIYTEPKAFEGELYRHTHNKWKLHTPEKWTYFVMVSNPHLAYWWAY